MVVSNTSPINYLVLIGQMDVLPALFGEITIPQAVRDELTHPDAPAPLRAWIAHPPTWLHVEAVVSDETDPTLQRLHRGERDAIVLAERLNADLILLDERAAREVALTRGLQVTGLIGVLDEAATRDLVDIQDAVARLQETSFRATPRLLRWLLDRHRT